MEQISIKTINEFFNSHKLTQTNIVVGVSGGMDSMVLLHLLKHSAVTIAVAHCNFGLRGAESDGDEAFVANFCNDHAIAFHSIKFDTTQYASEHGISIEMAARDLRYTWFEELANKLGFEYIAIAHNLNDSVETFFLNLTRGSGIKGLTGISPINGKIIRPLINASRDQIEEYAKKHGISWRTDATNLTDIYRRNFVRLNILPLFIELNPSFLATMQGNFEVLNGVNKVVDEQVEKATASLLTKNGLSYSINIGALVAKTSWEVLLFEMLTKFEFTSGEFDMAKALISSQTGSRVVSSSHTLWKERDNLVIEPNQATTPLTATLEGYEGSIELPTKVKWTTVTLNGQENKWQANQGVFDAEKLSFPLTLRCWNPGDSFTPSGMTGAKKVSDFLTDQKVESHRRSSILVMESGGKIAWVVGMRVSDLFRKKGNTGKAIIFSLD